MSAVIFTTRLSKMTKKQSFLKPPDETFMYLVRIIVYSHFYEKFKQND